MESYTPRKKDIVWLDFEPQSGKEINKRRPALVLSPADYNAKTNLAVFCPITSKEKGYPFEVKIPSSLDSTITGIILNVRAFVAQYPKLAKVVGFPDAIPADEAISGYI